MAQPEPTSAPSRWALLLLLLLSGEPVPAKQIEDLYGNPKGSPCSRIWQQPRFVAKKRSSKVEIKCYVNVRDESETVTWFWKPEGGQELKPVPVGDHFIKSDKKSQNGSVYILTIENIRYQDNGVYYCQQTCLDNRMHEVTELHWGCGTELLVMGFSTVAQMRRRNMLKDGIIMIQTLLIIVLIVVPIFLLLDKDDGKSGMEEDHTYEGLNIDQATTYEDIVTLRTGEVKWSVGEHPGQE
ncbi:B-cell antigen receptor complex-associated protein beta chain [Sorex araneus]|uniref:B-cell antigen receptor complex-associated protein beta chain n=1 Tax=Sorex araneus TaxID=42254 RepID=UPI0024338466|nr:B-cell antigen receptor complex-associated protein beta chain [Sorex araneus]